jgi:hypothetical protein
MFLITYEYIGFFVLYLLLLQEVKACVLWIHFVTDGMSFRNAHKGDNLRVCT